MPKRPPAQMSLAEQSPYCAVTCGCGRKVGAYLTHYQLVRCRQCGFTFWALRPKRNGILQLFPWPGTAEMAKAKAAAAAAHQAAELAQISRELPYSYAV